MKIFGSKKDGNNATDVHTPTSIDTTQDMPLHKDPMDEFSLDGLDLDALDDDFISPNQSVTPPSTVQTVAPTPNNTAVPPSSNNALDDDIFSFDDLDLGGNSPATTTTTQDTPSQTSAVRPNAQTDNFSSEEMDLDFFDSLNDLELNTNQAPTVPSTSAPAVDNTPTSMTEPVVVAAAPSLDKKPNLDNHAPPADFDDTIEKIMAQPTSAPVTPNKKQGLFNRVATKKTVVTKQPLPVKKKDNKLLMLLLPLLLLGAGAWYFMTQMNNEPQPAPVVAPVAKPKPASTTAVTPTIASTTTASATASTTNATASVSSITATTNASAVATTAITTVTAEEILKPSIPEDPAIAKEEIDRLAEQSNQLKEQEAMIEEQLRMMNELSDKKEERIKLLEQQIAQAEQQKAAQKAGKATAPTQP